MIFDRYPTLESDELILSKPVEADIPALTQMLSEDAVYRYEPTYLPERMSASPAAFILEDCDRLFQEKSAILLAVRTKDDPTRMIGLAELYGYSAERNKVSIGYRLMQEYWHRGIGIQVVALLKDYILKDLKITHITAHVLLENPASRLCLLRNGFIERRSVHHEDWGFSAPVLANKYVIYPAGETAITE